MKKLEQIPSSELSKKTLKIVIDLDGHKTPIRPSTATSALSIKPIVNNIEYCVKTLNSSHFIKSNNVSIPVPKSARPDLYITRISRAKR